MFKIERYFSLEHFQLSKLRREEKKLNLTPGGKRSRVSPGGALSIFFFSFISFYSRKRVFKEDFYNGNQFSSGKLDNLVKLRKKKKERNSDAGMEKGRHGDLVQRNKRKRSPTTRCYQFTRNREIAAYHLCAKMANGGIDFPCGY